MFEMALEWILRILILALFICLAISLDTILKDRSRKRFEDWVHKKRN